MKQYTLSIVIPTYREEKNIVRCIQESLDYLRKNSRIHAFEIIFVADDAGDKTIPLIQEHLPHHPELRLLVNSTRLQKGFSVRKGMLAAQYDLLLFYDADLSTPLTEIDHFFEYIDHYDICIASRGLKESHVEKKWSKTFLSNGFSMIKYLLLGLPYKDTQCGFKMFHHKTKVIFDRQTIKSSAFDVEILYIARKMGFSIKEIPVRWVDSAISNFTTSHVIVQFLKDMWKIRTTRYDFKKM
ncbi:glycosyltransferase [Candidatus Woesearchaeota archaeon]|nr:glycosyltransferase [Candidatus Woesearchaeota archaeon]